MRPGLMYRDLTYQARSSHSLTTLLYFYHVYFYFLLQTTVDPNKNMPAKKDFLWLIGAKFITRGHCLQSPLMHTEKSHRLGC